ncbi:hypothetical protein RQP46_005641 [Phenoliferia psychrophenolica]
MPTSVEEIEVALGAFKVSLDALPEDAPSGTLFSEVWDLVEERWSEQQTPTWKHLSCGLTLCIGNVAKIPESKMIAGAGGIPRVWELFNLIGATGLAAESAKDAHDAMRWIELLTMAVDTQADLTRRGEATWWGAPDPSADPVQENEKEETEVEVDPEDASANDPPPPFTSTAPTPSICRVFIPWDAGLAKGMVDDFWPGAITGVVDGKATVTFDDGDVAHHMEFSRLFRLELEENDVVSYVVPDVRTDSYGRAHGRVLHTPGVLDRRDSPVTMVRAGTDGDLRDENDITVKDTVGIAYIFIPVMSADKFHTRRFEPSTIEAIKALFPVVTA